MSTSHPIVQPNTRQALHRQKLALTARLRENWRLKVISLLAAVCLYLYTQNDRNPIQDSVVTLDVKCNDVPDNVDLDPAQPHITVGVSAPKKVMEEVKMYSPVAQVSLAGRPRNRDLSIPNVDILFPNLPSALRSQLHIEQKTPLNLKMRETSSRQMDVVLNFKPTNLNYHYGTHTITPASVTVTGWKERVDTIGKIVVDDFNANVSSDKQKQINADCSVHAVDGDGRIVSNIRIEPSKVHVSIPIVADQLKRYATVSPTIISLPVPPYNYTVASITPSRVTVTGNVDRLFTLQTEPLALKNETRSRYFSLKLQIPDGCTVTDEQGNRVEEVTAHILIQKPKTIPGNNTGNTIPPIPPVDPNG